MTHLSPAAEEINSSAYWENRFSSADWDAKGGREQSRLFMDVLIKYLPASVYEEISTQGLSILDCGCAEGDGTAVLARAFPHSRVGGFDFSPAAIEQARASFSPIEFFVARFTELDRSADALISSNCFEHLEDPISALGRLTACAHRFVLLLVPFLERFPADPEHVRIVHSTTFPEQIAGWRRTHCIVVSPTPAWEQSQLLMIYEPGDMASEVAPAVLHSRSLALETSLARVVATVELAAQKLTGLELEQQELRTVPRELEEIRGGLAWLGSEVGQGLEASRRELDPVRSSGEEQIRLYHELRQDLQAGLQDLRSAQTRVLEDSVARQAETTSALLRIGEEQIRRSAELRQDLRDGMQQTQVAHTRVFAESEARRSQELSTLLRLGEEQVRLANELRRDMRAELQEVRAAQARLADRFEVRQSEVSELLGRLREEERLREEALAEVRSLARRLGEQKAETGRLQSELATIHRSRLWRLGHIYWGFLRRLRPGGGSAPATPPAQTAATVPMAAIVPAAPLFDRLPDGVLVAPPGLGYDVVCFPIIDWDFRFQRPQQLMLQLARHGHRVFYVAQTFRQEGEPYRLLNLAENVYEVSLRGEPRNVYTEALWKEDRDRLLDSLDALRRDLSLGATAVVVQLPFWAPLAEETWRRFAWPIVYDCMDLHSGFSTNRPEMLEQERQLLEGARLVLASSRLLWEECRELNERVLLLPNGCDFEHFSRVANSRPGARPVIGYYGAIADWFDSDLVADLAERRPDWDFVLVGSTYTADLSRLAHLPNISLPGEQPYASLPGWLEGFDVLILPFRRMPLTEATNPVKAYEILASGRPLVSVPLPEMVPMAPHVKLAATAAEFEAEITAALADGEPARVEERRAFARENTWERRLEVLAPRLRDVFPKASIVLVTYNNLEINRQCLESLYARTEWPSFEVIAMDNGSTDGTPEYLAEAQKRHLSLHVVLNDHNAGFAAATNQGLRRAVGEYLVLLNNDTVLPRGWLSTLLRHLHARPEIGLIGPVSNAIGNQAKVEVGYEQVEAMPEWAARWVREHDGEVFPIPMLAMFCLAMRREIFERVGPLDERFGIGMFEDDDFNRRVRTLGYEIVCARDAFIHHWQKTSFRLLGEPEYYRIFEENRRLYEEKWDEPWNPEGIDLDLSLRRRAALPQEILERVQASLGVVIFLPSVGWGIHLLQRPHHLARSFAASGYLVVFDCSNAQDAVDGFREIEPNLFLFRGEQAVLHRLASPILWCFPYNFHLARGFPSGAVTVYDWIDDLSVFPYDRDFLESNHRRALNDATVVASVARKLDAEAREARADALYLPNAVEFERFSGDDATVPDDPKLTELLATGRPIAGYYGALAEWFDYDLLDEVACRRPDWSFVLIGPMYDGSLRGKGLFERPNVVWTGPRDYSSLHGYLRRFDVALIPFQINDITLATSPLKLYEFLAAGKPVIATALPECQAFPEVRIVQNAEELSRALDTALVEGQDERFRARLREIGRENSWAARVVTVLERIEEVSRARREAALTIQPGTSPPVGGGRSPG